MSKKVLLVDSNLAVQKMVEITLTKEGYAVACADNSLSALDMALKSRPDLILADLQLQGMKFEAFCQKLFHKERLNKIPLVLLIQSGEVADERRLRSAGISDFIMKPIDPAELVQKIRRYTEEREAPATENGLMMNARGLSSLENTIPPPTEAEREDILKIEEMLGWSQPSINLGPGSPPSSPAQMPEVEIVEVVEVVEAENVSNGTPDLSFEANAAPARIPDAPPAPVAEEANLVQEEEMVLELSQSPQVPPAPPESIPPPVETVQPVSNGPVFTGTEDLTRNQVEKMVRESIEQILWEVVPSLAEAEIKKAIEKLQQEV